MIKLIVFVALLLVVQICLGDQSPSGTFGYQIQCRIRRVKTGCQMSGEFEKSYFFNWRIVTNSRQFSADAENQIPSFTYYLKAEKTSPPSPLVHIFSSNVMGMKSGSSKCSPTGGDYNFCDITSEGSVRESGYPNCYHKNVVSCRRLKAFNCPGGYYFNPELLQLCKKCPQQYYSPGMNADKQCQYCSSWTDGTVCGSCPPGYKQYPDGKCEKCSPGTYAPTKRSLQCTPCPQGTYTDQSGTVQCKPCTGKTYQDGTGATRCLPCAHQTDGKSCQKCGYGQFFDERSLRCAQCSPGTYSDDTSDATACKTCSGTQYQDQSGQSSCKNCQHVTDGRQCQKCQPGTFWNQGNCNYCQPGEYQDVSTDGPCKKCTGKRYSDQAGATSCKTCQWETDGVHCIQPCSQTATGQPAGQTFKCRCPTVARNNVYQTSTFDANSNICNAAYVSGSVGASGGIISYSTGSTSFRFPSNQYEGASIEFPGEQHKRSVGMNDDDDESADKDMVIRRLQSQVDHLETKLMGRPVRNIHKQRKEFHQKRLEMIDRINNDPKATWKARDHPIFHNMTLREIRQKYFGVMDPRFSNPEADLPEHHLDDDEDVDLASVPESYDPRKKYPQCKAWQPMQQGVCGSCTSFSSISSVSARFCVQSQGRINVVLSPQDHLSCYSGVGCLGGQTGGGLAFLQSTGATTVDCIKYKAGERGAKIPCSKTCDDGYTLKKKYYAKKQTRRQLGRKSAVEALYLRGPIAVSYAVYESALNYASGIYKPGPNKGQLVERHASTIVGYGKDYGDCYWLILNSWGPDFGDKGYIKWWRSCDGTKQTPGFMDLFEVDPDFNRAGI